MWFTPPPQSLNPEEVDSLWVNRWEIENPPIPSNWVQDNDDLSTSGRNWVDCLQDFSGWNNIHTFTAVTNNLNPLIVESIFDNDNQPCPSFSQVIGCHPPDDPRVSVPGLTVKAMMASAKRNEGGAEFPPKVVYLNEVTTEKEGNALSSWFSPMMKPMESLVDAND